MLVAHTNFSSPDPSQCAAVNDDAIGLHGKFSRFHVQSGHPSTARTAPPRDYQPFQVPYLAQEKLRLEHANGRPQHAQRSPFESAHGSPSAAPASAGQVVLTPLHTSAMSHVSSTAARHVAPAAFGAHVVASHDVEADSVALAWVSRPTIRHVTFSAHGVIVKQQV